MLFPATVSVQSSSVRAAYSTTAMSHRNAYDSRFACIVQQKFPQHTHEIYTKDKYMNDVFKAKTFFFFKNTLFFFITSGTNIVPKIFFIHFHKSSHLWSNSLLCHIFVFCLKCPYVELQSEDILNSPYPCGFLFFKLITTVWLKAFFILNFYSLNPFISWWENDAQADSLEKAMSWTVELNICIEIIIDILPTHYQIGD